MKPKAWLIGRKWRAVIGKQIVSKRCFDTKAAALAESGRQLKVKARRAENEWHGPNAPILTVARRAKPRER